MIVLFHFLQPLLLSAAVARSVIRRLESFGVSRRVFDNFNGAESPWARLAALLDLSETCPFVREGGPIKKHRIYRCGFFKEIEMRDVKCLPVIKFASVCEFDDYLHLAT